MLYTLLGTDIEKIRARSKSLIDTLQERRPDASFFRLHLENWSNGQFNELTNSQGLFSAKYIILLDNILTGANERAEKKESTSSMSEEDVSYGISDSSKPADILIANLEALKKSDHIWIIVEDAMFGSSSGKELGVKQSKEITDFKKSLERYSDKIELHDKRPADAQMNNRASFKSGSKWGSGELTSFAFTDAFFERDTMKALSTLTLLEKQNTAPEEIHGALWWQTKILFQIDAGDTKKLSPFVVSKSTRFIKKWKSEEIKNLSNRIIESYHLAHLGKCDLAGELMKMTLGLGKILGK